VEIAIAFAAFSATASAIYIINDLVDLENDRQHPRKKTRPWASGALPLSLAPLMVTILLGIAATLCAKLPPSFVVTMLVYVGITSLYSFWLKREVLVDVFVLAALYSIRLVAGHAATGIATSVWLFMFSMFLFLSLALIKRAAEVFHCRAAAGESNQLVVGRGYRAGDMEQLSILGTGCGLMAVLVMALYVTSPDVQILYHRPALLLGACPLLLYWISRLWLSAHRGEMHDDPVVFAVTDRASYYVAAGIALAIAAAKFSHLVVPG
jgi:4-hydroxybenzoate polyprenyltransferase